MVGKIIITRSGYDPQLGKHVKDPYLGPCPTLGACRPDVREQLDLGDHVFFVAGKVRGVDQFVMGGFEIAEKISACQAYERFPALRLQKLEDGQLTGNIIVNAAGKQHELDGHDKFDRRVQNYVVGTNLLALSTAAEIDAGRKHTLDALRDILHRPGKSPYEIIGRCSNMTDKQVTLLRNWLAALKKACTRPNSGAIMSRWQRIRQLKKMERQSA